MKRLKVKDALLFRHGEVMRYGKNTRGKDIDEAMK